MRLDKTKIVGESGVCSAGELIVGLFCLLSSIAIPLPLFADPPTENGTPEQATPEITPTLNSSEIRALLLPQQESSPFEGLPGLRHVTLKSKPGDSPASLLGRFGLAQKERQLWLRSVQKFYPVTTLSPGKEIHFYLIKPQSASGRANGPERLQALEFELSEDFMLTWEKGPKGIVFRKREKPYDVELKTVSTVVENSPIEEGLNPQIQPALLSQLADLFSWDVDFNKDIRRGDNFKLLYEERSRKGDARKTSFHILAAQLINAGQKFFAIYFEKEKGRGNYYDLDGRSLARAFLRFPLEFTAITSQFSHSRFHPILKIDLPHHGVDFSAARGTPVRAVGDGKITYAGWRKDGYGRLVEVQHDSSYASRYAHLQGLARGLKKGMTVQKGQVIGYVGSSGRSTGPHLHFELNKDQVYVDPLNFDAPPETKIEPAFQRVFENAKRLFLAELAAPTS